MPIHLTCPTCSRAFTRKPAKVRERNFCSQHCRRSPAGNAPPVIIDPDGVTARIPLRDRLGTVLAVAVIDAGDAVWASQWTWYMSKGYARRAVSFGSRNQRVQLTTQLHRALLGLSPDDEREVDHIDRDRLNDRRSNLRILPPGANGQNKSAHRGAASTYRGVAWNRRRGYWVATISVGGKHTEIGRFDDELAAAEAAREARARLMPYSVD